MDCIRIYNKLDEFKHNPQADPMLWSILHGAMLNCKTLTVTMDETPHITLNLFRGKEYERVRSDHE